MDVDTLKMLLANIGREVSVNDVESETEALYALLFHAFKVNVEQLRPVFPAYDEQEIVFVLWNKLKMNVEIEYDLSEEPAMVLPHLKGTDDEPF